VRTLSLLALCALGCSATPASPSPDAGAPTDLGTPVDSPALTDTPAPIDAPPDAIVREADGCPPEEEDAGPRNPAAQCVRAVEGWAFRFDGNPLAQRVITVCGPICFAETTDDQGRFRIPVDLRLVVSRYSLQVHGRPESASLYVRLPAPGDDHVVRIAEPLRVPAYAVEGAEFPMQGGGSVAAGDVTVTVPPAARVEFDLEDFELGALGRRLRHVRVPVLEAPAFARGAMLVDLYALAPFALTATAPLGLSLPNTAMLPAGEAVEFVSLGHEIVGEGENAGRLVVVGRGRVSSDATRVITDMGEGPRVLTWVGVRRRLAP